MRIKNNIYRIQNQKLPIQIVIIIFKLVAIGKIIMQNQKKKKGK